MSVKRKCVCCGKEYDYCPSCPKKDQPGWMVTFCSESCKELLNIVSAYNVKRVSKEAVIKYMSEHNLEVDKYVDSVKRVLNEVSGTKEIEKVTEVNKKVLRTVNTETKSEGKQSETSASVSKYEYRPRRSKKRRNRQVDIELN